jgi:hypothetical protein
MESARLTSIRRCRRAYKAMLAGVPPSAEECRFVRVVLVLIFTCARTCVGFVLARKTRLAGTFQQLPARNARPPMPLPANFRLPQRRHTPDAGPNRIASPESRPPRNVIS